MLLNSVYVRSLRTINRINLVSCTSNHTRMNSQQNPVTQPNIDTEEITIKVPWGHISGKWWGHKNIRPIVCLHGRGDNAGTFETLIPLLPKHLSYLAIDVPGHGLSSKIPDGQAYTLINFIYWIYLIQEHFNWEKMSLMGHSMSAAHCFLYAGLFPQRCDLLILLDTLKPLYGNSTTEMAYLQDVIHATYKADLRNQSDLEPPTYTIDELIGKITHETFYSKISTESAPHLLRGIIPSQRYPDKYYLPLDRRIQKTYPQLSPKTSVEIAKDINIPFCFIKTRSAEIIHLAENDVLKIVEKNPLFEKHLVDVSDHHVHLNEPQLVSDHVSIFLSKYRPDHLLNELKGKL